MKRHELPYHLDSTAIFAAIAAEPWGVFLDSGYPGIDTGRYDLLSCRPYITLESDAVATRITCDGQSTLAYDDPFLLVENILGEPAKDYTDLPFCGGALGYFSYDLSRRIERLPVIAAHNLAIPDMAIGIYDWSVIVDHHRRRSWLVGACKDPQTEVIWPELVDLFTRPSVPVNASFSVLSAPASNMDKEIYATAFDRIKRYINAGDCYQVNLAQRFGATIEGDSWDVYYHLRKLNPAPFAGYLRLPNAAVLCSSPERFLRVHDGQVETRPIKGTIRRSIFAYEDKALASVLLESSKDRAENVMIVDLLRNDLSKSCKLGSVWVPQLFALESYASVHHLVSTVVGRLADGKTDLDLLRGCFPGGSVTGAPKLRAMEIIEELEPHRRSLYCGSLAYISYDGNMDSNICIRTMLSYKEQLYFWAGGGITSGSQCMQEYQECLDKVAMLLELLQDRSNQSGLHRH